MQEFTELEDELIWRPDQNPEDLCIFGKSDLCSKKIFLIE